MKYTQNLNKRDRQTETETEKERQRDGDRQRYRDRETEWYIPVNEVHTKPKHVIGRREGRSKQEETGSDLEGAGRAKKEARTEWVYKHRATPTTSSVHLQLYPARSMPSGYIRLSGCYWKYWISDQLSPSSQPAETDPHS